MTVRLMAWYAAAIGGLGVLPFLVVRLTDAGLDERQAALAVALLPLGTLVGGPMWAWAADRSQRGLFALRLALVGEAVAFALLLAPLPAWGLVASVALFAACRGPVFPLADALTVEHVGRGYGRIRAVGSAAYVVVVLVSGWGRGTPIPLALGGALLALAVLLTAGLPPIPSVAPPVPRDLRALLAAPGVRGLLAVTFLNGLSLSTYDHLFTLHVDRMGVADALGGLGVAWGVTVEVGVLAAGSSLLGRFGARRLLVVACAAGAPRFLITAAVDEPWALVAVQGLHGVQFGAFWLAAVDLMSELAPPSLRRSGQSLLAAVGFGLATLCSLGASALWLGQGDTRALFGALVAPALAATLAALRLGRGAPTPRGV